MLDNLDNNDKITLICGGVVLFVILFVIGTGFISDSDKNNEKVFDSKKINELFNKNNDSYTMSITRNLNNEFVNVIYYTDGKLELFESDTIDYGIIRYNDKLFCLNSSDMELSICNDENSFINDSFYDYDFIKLFTSECEYNLIEDGHVACNVKAKNFFEKYNYLNNTSFVGNDENVLVDVFYNGIGLSKLSIDYSEVYNVMNISNDKLIFNISFSLESNDFSEIYDHYKDVLES